MTKVCILMSGGIDSALLLHEALEQGREAYPFYLASGYLWEATEQIWLDRLLTQLQHKNLRPLKKQILSLTNVLPGHWAFDPAKIPDRLSPDEQVALPGRNLLLGSLAGLYAKDQAIGEIQFGVLKGNPFHDARPGFFRNLEKLLAQELDFSVKIQTPFLESTKQQLLTKYPDFPYDLTFSCLNPQDHQHCGNCNKCEERRKVFRQTGISDPTKYQVHD